MDIEDSSVTNDIPMCFWDFEMVTVETKFDLFDTITHTKIKDRSWQIVVITYYWNNLVYNIWDSIISEEFAEKIDEKKVWFSMD